MCVFQVIYMYTKGKNNTQLVANLNALTVYYKT